MIASKLNSVDDADDLRPSNGIEALINKLMAIKDNPTKKQLKVIGVFARDLAVLDSENNFEETESIAGVFYNTHKQRWIACVSVEGKKVHITTSFSKDACVKAVKEFRLEQGLKRSRRNEFCHF